MTKRITTTRTAAAIKSITEEVALTTVVAREEEWVRGAGPEVVAVKEVGMVEVEAAVAVAVAVVTVAVAVVAGVRVVRSRQALVVMGFPVPTVLQGSRVSRASRVSREYREQAGCKEIWDHQDKEERKVVNSNIYVYRYTFIFFLKKFIILNSYSKYIDCLDVIWSTLS